MPEKHGTARFPTTNKMIVAKLKKLSNIQRWRKKDRMISIFCIIMISICLANLAITAQIRIKIHSLLSIEDYASLEKLIYTFKPTVQNIYRRKDHILSLFNPFPLYTYFANDLNTLLNIPPLIQDCTFLTTTLLAGLQRVSIISNRSFPFLPPKRELPAHILSSNSSMRLRRQHLLILLLTSTKTRSRFDAARKSWIPHLMQHQRKRHKCVILQRPNCLEYFQCCLNISRTSSAKLIAISDEADYKRGIVTLPKLQGKTSYLDAQHRQLEVMRLIIENCERKPSTNCLLKNIRWVVLADDDTWFNVDKTLGILSLFDWKHSLAVGHILTEQESDKDLLYIAGGAGIFLSKPAFKIIASKLYRSCPFCKYNDLTIGACSAISNIERVHVPLFLAFRPTTLSPLVLSNVATIHYMKPTDMINSTSLL